jgi:RNA recognition motif-containing protein
VERAPREGSAEREPREPVVAKLGLSRSVYVGNLSWEVQWQDLKDHMKTVGEVCIVY